MESLDRSGRASEPLVGSLRTAPAADRSPPRRRDVRFVWSGDIAGQGWGINPELGGMTPVPVGGHAAAGLLPVQRGHVYADGPLSETVTLPDGRIWRNLVTDEKSAVAQTLAQYRGQFAYNLLDEHLRAFAAEVP